MRREPVQVPLQTRALTVLFSFWQPASFPIRPKNLNLGGKNSILKNGATMKNTIKNHNEKYNEKMYFIEGEQGAMHRIWKPKS